MMVKFYVDWENQEFYSVEQFYDKVKDIQNRDYHDDSETFDDWLRDNYSYTELFNLSSSEKDSILEEFNEWAENEIYSDLEDNGFTLIEIDI